MAIDKKKAAEDFKNRKVPRGIFAVRCKETGGTWVDSSPNLDAARNGTWFGLRAGGFRDKSLQAEWNAHGEDAFEFEVLEILPDDVAAMNLRDVLKERKRLWAEKLGATALP
jgi:hypothetical protein